MNAQVQPKESRALTLAERATSAIAISKTEAQLAELAASTASILEITNPAGYQQVHAARMTLKTQRVEIESAGKTARDDANKFAKAVIDAEKKLIGIIEPEEQRLKKLQDAWDDAKAKEKEAKAAAERARIAAIHERINYLHGNLTLCSLHSSSLLSDHISDLEALPVDESLQEFREEAEAVKSAGLQRLNNLLKAAQAREAEEQRLTEERAQLEREKVEANRVADIGKRMEEIGALGVFRPGDSSELLSRRLEQARAKVIDDTFAEFREQAQLLRDQAVVALATARDEQREQDNERARLAEERAELDRQRKDQEAAAAAERERIAEEERKAKEQRESEERAAAQRRAEEQRRLIAERTALEAESKAAADLQQRNEMAWQELQAIHHQLIIADTGRAPYIKGGTIEGLRTLIEETERWAITEETFGALTQSAETVRANVLEALRSKHAALLAAQPNIEVSGSVNAVEPDQPHGEGNAAIVASPSDGLESAHAATQVADTVALSLTSTRDLFRADAQDVQEIFNSLRPSNDELIFAVMAEFGADRETVITWLIAAATELQTN